MTRRRWLLASAVLSACGGKTPPLDAFPENVAGGWRRTALREVPVSESPDPVPRTSVLSVEAATYEGPGKLEARAYSLVSAAAGVDLVQRWRPSADTVFFNRGSYFVVVKWDQADRQALREFIRAIEARLPAK